VTSLFLLKPLVFSLHNEEKRKEKKRKKRAEKKRKSSHDNNSIRELEVKEI
jgi:hypothetical protein